MGAVIARPAGDDGPIVPGPVEPVEPVEPAAAVQPLGARVRRGALWSVGSSLLMRLANVALMVVVARIVAPEAFGVFTLALTAHAFIASVAELGISAAVARADLDIDRIAPTVTTISWLSSAALGAAMAIFADPLARLLGSADAAVPLRILALAVAMVGPFAVPGAQLQREFQQSRVFWANVVSFVLSTAVLIPLAALGNGAVAFAWSRVAGQLAAGLVMCAGVSRLYGPGFSRDQLRPLLRFSLPLAGANLLSQVLVNVDYVFVGRLLDVTAVGLYTLAFNVANWATSAIGSMLNGVVLPTFSRAKRDAARLEDAVVRGLRSVGVVACLVCGMTAGLARPLIAVLYGPHWSGAVPVLVVLSVYGVASVTCLLLANIVVAMGRTGSLFIVQVAALVVLGPALYIGIGRAGIVGAGFVHVAVVLLVTLPVYANALRSATGTRIRTMLRAFAPPVVAGVFAGVVAHLLSLLPLPDVVRLLLGGVAGMTVYAALMARDLADIAGSARVPTRVVRAIAVTDPLRRWLVGRVPVPAEVAP